MGYYDNFLDDTHRLTRDTCRRFAEREIAPHAHEWEEAEIFPARSSWEITSLSLGYAPALSRAMTIEMANNCGNNEWKEAFHPLQSQLTVSYIP